MSHGCECIKGGDKGVEGNEGGRVELWEARGWRGWRKGGVGERGVEGRSLCHTLSGRAHVAVATVGARWLQARQL